MRSPPIGRRHWCASLHWRVRLSSVLACLLFAFMGGKSSKPGSAELPDCDKLTRVLPNIGGPNGSEVKTFTRRFDGQACNPVNKYFNENESAPYKVKKFGRQ